MTTAEPLLLVADDGPVRTITLRRESHLNALDTALAIELLAALRSAGADDDVRVVILTGAGSGFSAGQDVYELVEAERQGGATAVGDQLRRRLNPLIVEIRRLEKPVIAQMNGVAAGAGLGVAMACDFRVAAERVKLVMSPVGIGLIPGVGLSFLVPRLIGIGPATELFLLGARVEAARALQLGLVTSVVPDDNLREATLEFAAQLVDQPREVLGLTKRALNRSIYAGLEDHLNYECALQEIAASTEEHRSRLARITTPKHG